ncbi:MAG: drug efflux transport system permease protein ybhF [Verrucomicrobiota bacterium]|jgi:ABC-type multidrug transport system permease subunit
MNRGSFSAILSVAYKEFLHIYRDKRVLILLLVLPPVFTLVFGHAFEAGEMTNVPAMLINRDGTSRAERFMTLILANKTFQWQTQPPSITGEDDLLGHGVQATLVIPQGWSESLNNGNPIPLLLYADGSDTNTADLLEGSVQKTLADFQLGERQVMIDSLPEEVFELSKKLPVQVRKQFVSMMEPWSVNRKVLYNPRTRFIDYVVPGVIGLILQLITVTLMASTLAREREAGTLYQLMVTSLRRREIVLGKILPYLGISIALIVFIILLTGWHFEVQFHDPGALALICFLFLLCSLGMGLLISAISRTQTQAIQFSVFFLLPVFVLSGAFAPLEQLPRAIRYISELFPLTHFCRAFRLVNLYRAAPEFYAADLIMLSAGVIITFIGAGYLLRRIEQ